MEGDKRFVQFIEPGVQPMEITPEFAQAIKENDLNVQGRYGGRDKFVKGIVFNANEPNSSTQIFVDNSGFRHASIAGQAGISIDDVTDAGRIIFQRDTEGNVNNVIVSGDSVGLDKPTRESAAKERADTASKLRTIFEAVGIPVTVQPLKRTWKPKNK